MDALLLGILSFFLILSALAAVFFDAVINSILSLSVFSILLTVIFAIYQAPDVAMAEAVVGAGLLTALFVVTISKTTGNDRGFGP